MKEIAKCIVPGFKAGAVEAAIKKPGRLDTSPLYCEALGIDTSDVFVASTGVIGNPMPMGRVKDGIKKLPGALREDGFGDAARGIMTPDTFQKVCGVREKA